MDSSPAICQPFFAPGLRHRRFFAITLRWVLALMLAVAAASSMAAPPSHNVLVLYSDNRLRPVLSVIDETIDAVLHGDSRFNVEIYNELLGLDGRRGGEYRDHLTEMLGREYASTRFDAIIVVGGQALKYLLGVRDQLFPGVPVVHLMVTTGELVGMTLPPDVVGAPVAMMPAKTFDLALELRPGTKRVVVITGTSSYDLRWEALLRQQLKPLAQRVAVEFWAGLPLTEILDRIGKLPTDTIVYLPGLRQDGTGQYLVPQKVARQIVSASSVPVFGNASNFEAEGTAGGYILPLDRAAQQAADLAMQLLRGEKPVALNPPAVAENRYILNMHQLRRFGIDEAALPADAILRYQPLPLWATYRWQIAGVLALVLLQAALIGGLLLQRRDRRQARAELRESEERLSLAAAAAGLGVWVFDPEQNTVWASEQHRALLGFGSTEPYSIERLLKVVHPDDRQAVGNAIGDALANGTPYDIVYRIVFGEEQVRWIAARGRADVDTRGRPARFRGVSLDVTARREAELEAQRHRNELAHVSRIGMLGQLSGSIAHELNQPLTAILSNAQAALRFMKADSVDLDEVREILDDIVADDKRAGEVILRLRALFERGEAKQEWVDVNELVVQVLRLLHSDLVSRNVPATVDLDAALPNALGDRVQLQQLLLNLILNACEAMKDVPPPARRLTVRSAIDRHGQIAVTVSDSGTGIAPEKLESIFEPFVTTKEFGVGLGLVIARSIIAAHGGQLSASNDPEGGAEFTFTLPAQPSPESPKPVGEGGGTMRASVVVGDR